MGNNNSGFDELEFFDEDNDDGGDGSNYVLPLHWPNGCIHPFHGRNLYDCLNRNFKMYKESVHDRKIAYLRNY